MPTYDFTSDDLLSSDTVMGGDGSMQWIQSHVWLTLSIAFVVGILVGYMFFNTINAAAQKMMGTGVAVVAKLTDRSKVKYFEHLANKSHNADTQGCAMNMDPDAAWSHLVKSSKKTEGGSYESLSDKDLLARLNGH